MSESQDESTSQPGTDLVARILAMATDGDGARRRFFEESSTSVARAAQMIVQSIRGGGKLLIFGNGGSAADAQHVAAELTFRMGRMRQAIPAIALTTDTSVLTAIANDRAFEYVFARQIEALGRPGDIALAISTSGNSANVVEAVKQARLSGVATIGLLGGSGGVLQSLVDLALVVPHSETPRIQEIHLATEHIICQLVEDLLFPQD